MRPRWSPVVVTLAFASAGCAEIRLRTRPEVVQEVIVDTHREEVAEPDVQGKVEQHDNRVTLSVWHRCNTHQFHEVRRTIRRAHYDANARGTRALGLTGAALAAAGVLVSSLPAMRVRTSTAADLGIGLPLTTLGVALAADALVGVKRAHDKEETFEVRQVDEGAVGPVVECGTARKAAAGILVDAWVVGGPAGLAAFPVGMTDDDGGLEIDLGMLSRTGIRAAPPPKRLNLFAAGTLVGQVSVANVERDAEERAWARADLAGCAASTSELVCASVEQFVSEFPDSPRAVIARKAIEHGRASHLARRKADIAAQAASAREADRARAEASKRSAKIDRAASWARRAAIAACSGTCSAVCGQMPGCLSVCVERSCSPL